MWWPHPDAFDDLTVTDTETGYQLSAPDGSECAIWLEYFNHTEELHEEFETCFVEMLREAANTALTTHSTEEETNG
jgi:hypothetical protein